MLRFYAVALLALLGTLAGCAPSPADSTNADAPPEVASFTGSDACADCHQSERTQWLGSHHQLAMQEATPANVLGQFDGQSLMHSGISSTLTSRGDRFFIDTQDAQGVDQTFEITHTFGVSPLQQYLIATRDGRKQALQYAWDSRAKSQGGQRWFHLYPDESIPPDDPLHWTGPYFNWNVMCAECHSTNVRVNYTLATDSFDTRFDEISVGCEACHGPGSQHIAQANNRRFQADLGLVQSTAQRKNVAWIMDNATGIARRNTPNVSQGEVEACGRCHARRGVTTEQYEYGQPLTQTHLPALLEEGLYHSDGRILDEVYVYGSFLQSKMYQAGVTCGDCHNPHSGALRAGPDPNDTCAQCHLASRFATPEHNPASVGECVACHMPSTTYMQIDDRRDHSFRLPGTAADPNHYGAVIAAGRAGANNQELLDAIAKQSWPVIVDATILSMVQPANDVSQAQQILAQLGNRDPLMRIAALRALRRQSPDIKMRADVAILGDDNRAVRIEAAQTFAQIRDYLPPSAAASFALAANDYRAFMTLNAAMPNAAATLAEFESQLGNAAAAQEAYLHALKIGPNVAAVHHGYGLHLIRQGQREAAINYLERAAILGADVSRYVYVYGVALNGTNRPGEAIQTLLQARARFPDDFDVAWALATILRDHGDRDQFLDVLDELVAQYPDNSQVRALASSTR